MNLTTGELIKIYRCRKGLKHVDLGKICFSNLQAPHVKVRKLEAGIQNPSKEDLEVIADALDVTVKQLLPQDVDAGVSININEGLAIDEKAVKLFPKLKEFVQVINSVAKLGDPDIVALTVKRMLEQLN